MSTWIKVTNIQEVPSMGARKVLVGDTEIALFKTKDNSIFAIENKCPHKEGKLSEGLVHEHIVTCPLHNNDIELSSGESIGEDYTCAKTYSTKIEEDFIYLEI